MEPSNCCAANPGHYFKFILFIFKYTTTFGSFFILIFGHHCRISIFLPSWMIHFIFVDLFLDPMGEMINNVCSILLLLSATLLIIAQMAPQTLSQAGPKLINLLGCHVISHLCHHHMLRWIACTCCYMFQGKFDRLNVA